MAGKEEGNQQDHKGYILLWEGEEEYSSVDEYQEFSQVKLMKQRNWAIICHVWTINELDQSKRKDHALLMSTDYLVI